MNGDATTHQLVGLFFHPVITEDCAEIHSRTCEPRRLLCRSHDASTDIGGIAPDHDELRVGKPRGQMVHAIVVVGRFTSPDGRAFLSRVLLGSCAKSAGQIYNVFWNAGRVNLVPSQGSIPGIYLWYPGRTLPRQKKKRRQQREVRFVHESDLRVLVEQGVQKRGSRTPHSD